MSVRLSGGLGPLRVSIPLLPRSRRRGGGGGGRVRWAHCSWASAS